MKFDFNFFSANSYRERHSLLTITTSPLKFRRKRHSLFLKKMGRKKLWNPTYISIADIVRGSSIREKYGPNMSTITRVKEDFNKFKSMNNLQSEDALEPWVGQMLNSGLSRGSVDDYVQMVTSSMTGQVTWALKKAVAAMHGDTITGHAPDVSFDKLERAVSSIIKDDDPLGHHVWLLLATGSRSRDVARFRGACVSLEGKDWLTVKYLWTKGIKRTVLRREVRYPIHDIIPPPRNFVLACKGRNTTPFHGTANKVRVLLKNQWIKLKFAGKAPTACSFRRNFSKRIDPYCRRMKIAKQDMMLHISDAMDKAYYSFDNKTKSK